MKLNPLTSGARVAVVGSRPGLNKASVARVSQARTVSEPDDDIQSASDDLDGIATSLGVDADLLRLSLLAGVEAYATKTRDGDVVKFEDISNPGTEVKAITFTSSASKQIRCMSGSAGWYVPFIGFDVDGGGDNDVATAMVTVEGHDPTPERHLIRGGKGLDFGFGRVLGQSVEFTLEAPGATATGPVTVFFAANGEYPTAEKVEAVASAMAPALPQRQREAGKRKRSRARVREAGTGAAPAWLRK